MSKFEFLSEDSLLPSGQKYVCVSFFSKNMVKQIIDNNNDNVAVENKEEYSTNNNVLAFKIRGCFDTYEIACEHAKKLQSVDEYHNVYVAEMGKWCAFMLEDNDKYVNQTEYANEELNGMMKKYMENQEKSKLYHELRKNDIIKKNLEENIDQKKNNEVEIEKEYEECENKEKKDLLKENILSIEDQIAKMEIRRKELEDRDKDLTEKLNLKNKSD